MIFRVQHKHLEKDNTGNHYKNSADFVCLQQINKNIHFLSGNNEILCLKLTDSLKLGLKIKLSFKKSVLVA
jgi:hypothetical protein